MWETGVQSQGGEAPLEKELATHSSILAWETPWTEEPGGLHPWGRKEADTTSLSPTFQVPTVRGKNEVPKRTGAHPLQIPLKARGLYMRRLWLEQGGRGRAEVATAQPDRTSESAQNREGG